MKTRFSYPCIALISVVFFVLATGTCAQSLLQDNNIPLTSSASEKSVINDNDNADPAVQSVDDGLYIYRPEYILGFSPFTKGFWKLNRFGYYSWVYNLYDYTLNNYYDYYNRACYGGWLFGRMNIYGFNGWNYNQTLFYPNVYFNGLYGLNGNILYKPLIKLKNTNVNVPLTSANNFFFSRLFEKNKLPSEYVDSFDDKTEKKPKPLNLSKMNSAPVVKTDNISKREAKKINYYYKTKYDDYYNSLNRNFGNGNNISNRNSGINGTSGVGTSKSYAVKGSYSNNSTGSSVTGIKTGSTSTNNQGSKSNTGSNNSGSKQQNTGDTKK